jgi:excisionase family DNA binding protein
MIEPNTAPTVTVEKLTHSPAEAAQALGVSRETIYRLLARGKLRAVPGLRHKLIPKLELVRFANGV